MGKRKNRPQITQDFLIEQLPSTRGKQFFDIVKNEWRTLLLLGLLLALFFLPFAISNIFEAGYMNGSAESLRAEMLASGKTEEEIVSAVSSRMRTIHILFNGVNVVCFMAFFVGLAGVSRIVKCLCFGEGVLFKSDFFTGVKKYWKPFLLAGFSTGLLYFLVSYASAILTPIGQESGGFSVLSGITIGFYYAIVIPMILFCLAQSTLYNLPLFKSLSNSLRFFIVRYYITAIFALIIYGISLVTMIVYPLLMILCYLLIIILICPFLVLGFHLFALSLFDKYINEENYPSIYKKGLYVKKEVKSPHEKEKG